MYYSKQIVLGKEEDKEKIYNKIVACDYTVLAKKENMRSYSFPTDGVDTNNNSRIRMKNDTLESFYMKTRLSSCNGQLRIKMIVMPKIKSLIFLSHVLIFLVSIVMIIVQYLNPRSRNTLVLLVMWLFVMIYNYLKMRLFFKGEIELLIENLRK